MAKKNTVKSKSQIAMRWTKLGIAIALATLLLTYVQVHYQIFSSSKPKEAKELPASPQSSIQAYTKPVSDTSRKMRTDTNRQLEGQHRVPTSGQQSLPKNGGNNNNVDIKGNGNKVEIHN